MAIFGGKRNGGFRDLIMEKPTMDARVKRIRFLHRQIARFPDVRWLMQYL
jgi:hypothetical protein